MIAIKASMIKLVVELTVTWIFWREAFKRFVGIAATNLAQVVIRFVCTAKITSAAALFS